MNYSKVVDNGFILDKDSIQSRLNFDTVHSRFDSNSVLGSVRFQFGSISIRGDTIAVRL